MIISSDEVIIFGLSKAAVDNYKDKASISMIAAVALGKVHEGPIPLKVATDGTVCPDERLVRDFRTWKAWLDQDGSLWVTKKKVPGESYGEMSPHLESRKLTFVGYLPAISYLTALCIVASLDPGDISAIAVSRMEEGR